MNYPFEKRSAARKKGLARMGPERLREAARKAWETRRRNGTDKPRPEQRAAIREKFRETLRRNRAARAAAMTPEERVAEVMRRHERMSAGARRGWIGRRERLGLPPGRTEAGKSVRLYAADVAELERIGGTARAGVRRLLRLVRVLREEGFEVRADGERQ
jgi:hypothetical protein